MKILSWNVNGLRAVERKGNWSTVFEFDPDVICIQETKALPEQLSEELRNPSGYHSYFDYPKLKKGYSGVAIYSKIKPERVEYLMGVETLDNEGRLIAVYYKDFVLVNVYFPNGGGGPVRLQYKLDFYAEFLRFVNKLVKAGHKVVFCGDINTAHTEIDLARPKENEDHTGFLPIERAWLDEVVKSGFVDVFRHFYPETIGAYTYWDMKTFARERNVGWRIDYFFVSPDMLPLVKKITILDSVLGSDHCPLLLELKL